MEKLTVFFVSDHTGVTAEAVGHSLLSQFRELEDRALTVRFVDTPEKAEALIARVRAAMPAVIVSTLTAPLIRARLRACEAPLFDVFDAFSEPLAALLGRAPTASFVPLPRKDLPGAIYHRRSQGRDQDLSRDGD